MKSATQSQDRKAAEREGQKESHSHDMRTDSNGVEGDGSAAMTNAGVVHEPWWLGGLFVSTSGYLLARYMNSVLSLDSGSCVKRVTDSRVQTLSKTIKGLSSDRQSRPYGGRGRPPVRV